MIRFLEGYYLSELVAFSSFNLYFVDPLSRFLTNSGLQLIEKIMRDQFVYGLFTYDHTITCLIS